MGSALQQMKAMATYPRVLADDLQLIATGPRHADTFQCAFDTTHTHLHDMGAKLAPSKSIIFLLIRMFQNGCARTDGEALGPH